MVDLICIHCGNPYSRTPSVAKYSRFCCRQCKIAGLTGTRRSLAERFWEKVNKRGPDECWPWIGGTFADGYGAISINGKPKRAPRVSVLLDGRQVNGLHVLHSCDNPICVNPSHLMVGSHQENMTDMLSKGRLAWKTKVTDEQVAEIRSANESGSMLAKQYGVSIGLISLIRGAKPYRNNGANGKSVRATTRRHPRPRS